jgi:hypothetical protein
MEKLLTEDAVAQITGRSTSTLQKDRVAGTGIPYVKIGRQVRYRELDVVAFCAARVRRATSEPDQFAEVPINSSTSGKRPRGRPRKVTAPSREEQTTPPLVAASLPADGA